MMRSPPRNAPGHDRYSGTAAPIGAEEWGGFDYDNDSRGNEPLAINFAPVGAKPNAGLTVKLMSSAASFVCIVVILRLFVPELLPLGEGGSPGLGIVFRADPALRLLTDADQQAGGLGKSGWLSKLLTLGL